MSLYALLFSLLWGQGVGIGVALPAARLHVEGTGNSHASSALIIENAATTPLLIVRDDQRVGIGVTSPAQTLHVGGNLQFSGAFLPGGNAGNAGQYLHSQGANLPPIWHPLESGWGLWQVDSWDAANNTAQGWTGANVTQCGGQFMLGGFGQCGSGCVLEKTFNGLPPHEEVVVQVYYWAIDSWDHLSGSGVDHVRLEIEGTPVGYAIPGHVATNLPGLVDTDQSLCGNPNHPWVDRGPFLLIGHAAHTNATLTVQIRAMLNQSSNDESLGITAVYIWLR